MMFLPYPPEYWMEKRITDGKSSNIQFSASTFSLEPPKWWERHYQIHVDFHSHSLEGTDLQIMMGSAALNVSVSVSANKVVPFVNLSGQYGRYSL